ncbi:alpha/beta fold hydrolase [Jannaschia pohangensis]|uniref:Alpha/beta hydrolase family protein n=1 Tax=Jannaschia pohangensis TaxID=390807 RepID=A0A1I3QUK7_9RHOB|nr:alpha/beta hydrolase [Jannaschia pohangensis]SFJ36777.1 hypothetical protein SAMN04488095_2646 [Jannaschia pohangensis]
MAINDLINRKRIQSLLTGRKMKAGDSPLRDDPDNEIIYDDADMTVLRRPGTGKDCIVSFTGIGRAMGGIDLQTPEFTRSGGDAEKIFVIDKNRTWGNSLGWSRLDKIVARLGDGRRIITLGNSMGGFLAILAATRFGARHALAFVPQWSVDPALVPWEKRWVEYREKIRAFVHPDLSGAFTADCRHHVFFGDHLLDSAQFEAFPKDVGGLDLFRIEQGGHELAGYLKTRGLLYPVIDACLSGRDVGAVLTEGGVRFQAT